VKLRIMVLMLCGVAGVGASFAFASGGRSHGQDAFCKRVVLFGTVSAPQSFSVTVSRSWWRSSLKPGQSVNVNVGSSGQTLRFMGQGCVGSDGTVTVNQGVLQVVRQHHGDGPPSTTTTSDPPSTTTTNDPPTTTNHEPSTTTNGDPPTTTNHEPPPSTTTNATTTTTKND